MSKSKTIYKPWGKEVWLELNDKYCYKRIYINAGTEINLIDKANNKYALSLKDFAIIVKSNADAAAIINHLERNDIKVIADNGVNIFSRPVVSFVLDCISYVFGCPGYTTEKEIPELEELASRLKKYSKNTDINFKQWT